MSRVNVNQLISNGQTVNTSDLFDLINYDDQSINDVLDNAKVLANYTALRSYNGRAKTVRISQSGIAGLFYLDTSDTTSQDNGGTIIVSGNRRYKRFVDTNVYISWFRTVPKGSNDTIGLQNALKYVFDNNKCLVIDDDVYTTRVSVSNGKGSISCTTGIIYAHSDTPIINSYDNMLIDFRNSVTYSNLDLKVDLGGKGHSGIFVRGGNNTIRTETRNSVSQSGQISGTRGLLVSGDYCQVPFVKCSNFISIPEQGDGASALTVAGYAKATQVGKIIAEGGSGALLNNGQGTQVESIYLDGCLDNGVYDIEGAKDLKIGSVYAINCPDEVVVFNRSLRGRVDNVYAINCGRGVGVTNAVSPSIGTIFWKVDSDSLISSGSALFSRPNQTEQTNEITVDKLTVRGIWQSGAPIFSFQNLGVKRLFIGEIDADVTYTANATKSLSFFDSLDTIIDIGKLSVIVRDGTGSLTSSDIFTLNIIPTTALGGYSSIGGFKLSNGGGVHAIRAPRINDPSLVINDMIRIRSDIGTPFATNEDDQSRVRIFYSGTVPTTGSWLRGDIVFKTTPGTSSYCGWECVASGAPGTWKQFGAIEA